MVPLESTWTEESEGLESVDVGVGVGVGVDVGVDVDVDVGVGVGVGLELCEFDELGVESGMLATVHNVLTEFRSFEYMLVALCEVNSRNCLFQKLAMKPKNRLLVNMFVHITHHSVRVRHLISGHEAKMAQLLIDKRWSKTRRDVRG